MDTMIIIEAIASLLILILAIKFILQQKKLKNYDE